MIDKYPSLSANWNYPTKVRFGPGRIKELAEACRAVGISRPLLVTDPGLKPLPMIMEAIGSLEQSGLASALFADVHPNPVGADVEAGLKVFRNGKHDGVVVFGGGSAMDAGKAIAFMSGQTRPMWDYEDREDWWTRADAKGIAPIVAVPTTAGTGSEVGRASVITDERDHTKKIIFHPKMQPAEVIADPELTVGLPPHITAATGMDALSHNLEAFCSPFWHPMAQGIALEGMRLVKDWLPTAVKQGSNIEARSYMLAASSMGATAFQKGLGAMHSMSHPCSSLRGTHHGLTNAVVMPYVLVHNKSAIEEKLAAAARYMGLKDQSFNGYVDWVLAIREEIGIPNTLKEIGFGEDAIPEAAPMALEDPSTGGNPLPMTVGDYERLYRNAIEGRLV
ncbi:iron-containing alcohol dehydrogenase [Parvibaculum sp.]|uniref:iron-containing alcohol dehydrogenase n=1 Tax=Parvibaculum sp. TaxID=2024848 RepID=UPI002C916F8A|nr:iron-containing alcohol dehydrogenase [Parvibaculum sp.]HUD52886.1 iron-containing alcohol dehydrogenase [Parvibaculum sp.]